MVISILENSREHIIMPLNELPDLLDSAQLKSKCLYQLKHLRLSMGHKPPVCLDTTNTLE